MQRIDFLTPFPQVIRAVVETSILGRAAERELVTYHAHSLFDYADPPHNKIDDEPFGGGAGMVMKPEPVLRAYEAILAKTAETKPLVIYPTPDGIPFRQEHAVALVKEAHLIFLCGHYKGVDQRIRDELVTHEYSVGDFVLTGGELPALAMADSIVRLHEGALNTAESAESDSFGSMSEGLLDAPHYTRPREYRGLSVPEVLLSGHHGEIEKWRREQREKKTRERRADLWEKYVARDLGNS